MDPIQISEKGHQKAWQKAHESPKGLLAFPWVVVWLEAQIHPIEKAQQVLLLAACYCKRNPLLKGFALLGHANFSALWIHEIKKHVRRTIHILLMT